MNQKSAREATADEIFQRENVLFANIPGQSRLFLDFQANRQRVEKFYPKKNAALENFAAEVLSNYRVDRTVLCGALAASNRRFGAGAKTFENIERLRAKNCLAIVTGQQAGLFTGALYTVYKTLSVVKLAADLTKKGIETVPIFWIAEEDHDFNEVKKTFNLDGDGALFASENTPGNYRENRPVGLVELDATIERTVADLFEKLPRTEFSDEIRRMLARSYRAKASYSLAFARFLAELFAAYGLIVVSPLDAALKTLCAPIFAEAVERSADIASALLERNEELAEKNYQPQVTVKNDFFPFFLQSENGARETLRRHEQTGEIKIQNTKIRYEIGDLEKSARDQPQRFSPNALMRPIVQDFLLPTLTYFGGAAEVAYFAQNSAIYRILNRPATPIRHRASATVVERRHRRTLEKYRIKFADLFAGKEKAWARVAEEYLNPEAARVFGEVERNIDAELRRLGENLSPAEPTLAANLINRREKIVWHLAALRKKYHRAETLKNDRAARSIENLFAALLPHNALQERTVNVTTFLNLYGTNFIEWLYQAIETDGESHQILYF